jgi:hypothetical protein
MADGAHVQAVCRGVLAHGDGLRCQRQERGKLRGKEVKAVGQILGGRAAGGLGNGVQPVNKVLKLGR